MDDNKNYEYENIVKYRNCLSDMLSEYNWEWFVTLNLPTSNIENTEKYLKQWRCKVCTENHIQICYLGNIITYKITGNHVHLLMSGKNKNGETLLDMDAREWERHWGSIAQRGSAIECVRDNGVIDYMTSTKNTPYNHYEIVTYNTDLLKKSKKLN